jgi:hypothetical protein
MKNITPLLVLVTFGILLTVVPAHTARGQANGTTHMENPKVKQGDYPTMDIVLDKASNLPGSVSVTAFPEGMTNGGVTFSCGLQASQSQCKAVTSMPLDAKIGKWNIDAITFAPSPSGSVKVLAKHGESSFEVIAHGEVILPDGATVSDIK